MNRLVQQKQKVKPSKIPLRVKFQLFEETVRLGKISVASSIRDLKSHIELAVGIPAELQQLSYLDDGELSDDQQIRNIDIVSNAVINLKIWHTWKDLVMTSCENNIEQLFSMGVTEDSEFQTATSEYMLPKQRREWLKHRASVALFIACHRGHFEMARRLLQSGASANCQTDAGRTPLHVAAAVNNTEIVDLLLDNGADIDLTDFGTDGGKTAHDLAAAAGHKACERRLFMHRWEKRAYKSSAAAKNSKSDSASESAKLSDKNPLEFQRSDSSNPRWRVGPQAQVYMETLSGTSRNSAMESRTSSRVVSGGKTTDAAAKVDREPTQNSSISYDQWRHRKIQQQQRQNTDTSMASNLAGTSRHYQQQKHRSQKPQRVSGSGSNLQQQQQQQHQDILVNQLIDATSRLGDLQQRPSLKFQQQLPTVETKAVPDRRRGPVDPQLNAYEQWLKDRSDGDHVQQQQQMAQDSSIAGAEPTLLPYQIMIEEFCKEKCSPGYYYQ